VKVVLRGCMSIAAITSSSLFNIVRIEYIQYVYVCIYTMLVEKGVRGWREGGRKGGREGRG